MMRLLREKLVQRIPQIVLVIVGLVIWEVASGWLVPEVFFSTPRRVASRLTTLISSGDLTKHAVATLSQAGLGFLLGAVSGVAAGNLLGLIRPLGKTFGPILTFFYTLPRIAIAPLFVIWFGIGPTFKVAFVAFVMFFMFQVATLGGIRAIDSAMIDGIRVMGANRRQLFVKTIVPQQLLWIGTTVKVAAPMAVATDIVGEFVAASEGLGFLMRNASAVLDITTLLAVVLFIAIVVTSFLGVVILVENYLFRWQEAATTA